MTRREEWNDHSAHNFSVAQGTDTTVGALASGISSLPTQVPKLSVMTMTLKDDHCKEAPWRMHKRQWRKANATMRKTMMGVQEKMD